MQFTIKIGFTKLQKDGLQSLQRPKRNLNMLQQYDLSLQKVIYINN